MKIFSFFPEKIDLSLHLKYNFDLKIIVSFYGEIETH